MNERADRERQLQLDPEFGGYLRQITNGAGEHVFAFRIGYALDEALPSPRRSVEEVRII